MEAAELCRGPQSPANTKRASFNRKLSREPQLYMAACLHLSFTKEGHNWDSVQIPECMPQVEQRYFLGKWSKWKLRVPQKKRAQVQNSHHVTCTVLPIHNSHHAPRTMLPLLRSIISQHKRENRNSHSSCSFIYLLWNGIVLWSPGQPGTWDRLSSSPQWLRLLGALPTCLHEHPFMSRSTINGDRRWDYSAVGINK